MTMNYEQARRAAAAGQVVAGPTAPPWRAGRRPNVACRLGRVAAALAIAFVGAAPARSQMPLPILPPAVGAPPDWPRIMSPPLPMPEATPVVPDPSAGWNTPLPFPFPATAPADDASEEEAASADDPAIATSAQVSGDNRRSQLTIDLSRKIDMRAFTLAEPYRVVIEIPQVDFQLPPNTGEQGQGIIKAFRYGTVMRGGSRIVIDLTGPVRVTKAVVLDPADGRPARMVLDIVAVDRETFMRAAAIDNHLPRLRPPPAQTNSGVQEGDLRPVVVIDPGHGGIDSGTRAPSGELEKDLTLEFANALRAKLEAAGKYRVVMTRSDDSFIELSQRVQIARQNKAQLLISIHCDALARGEGEAEGATVYTLSDKASDGEAQRLADTENRADVIGGVDLADEPGEIADILIDLAQRETKAFSTNFARNVVKDMAATARMHKHPLRSARFRVLKAPDVPSVLIELGYVSNARDLRQLVSDAWRAHTADAITRAVQTYFTTRLAGGGPPSRTQ